MADPLLPSGFAASHIPTNAFAVRLGVGVGGAPPSGLRTLLVGPKTAAGTAALGVPFEVGDAVDANAQCGARSRLAFMARAFRTIAPFGRLSACAVAEPAGGIAATAVLLFSGTATGAGALQLRVAGRLLREVVIASGTTAAQAAALVLAAVAEVSELPCTGAVGGSGSEHVLTLTAANLGQTGNQLRVAFVLTAAGLAVALNGATAAARGKGYFGGGSAIATAGRSTGSGSFPVRLANGDTLVVAIDGGGNATATFAGFARRLTGVGGTLADVTDGHSLVLLVHGVARSVSFTTENTATLFAATINAIPGVFADVVGGQVRITTDRQGTGASLVVDASTNSTVLASLGLSSGQVGAALGASNVADIEAVTAAEFEAVVEAAVAGSSAGADADGHPFIQSASTGVGSTVQVQASSTADDEMGFDNVAHAGTAGTPAVAGVGTLDLGAVGSTPTGTWGAIAGARYDRIALDADDDGNLAEFGQFLTLQSGINVGLRCVGVTASLNETLSGVGSVAEDAQALNEPLLTLLYNRRSHNPCAEVAAAYCAAKVYGDGRLPGEDQYRAAKANGLSLYPVVLATDEEERLSRNQVNSLLAAGVTPLGADGGRPGYACVIRPVTTRTLNAQGGADYKVHDTSKVAVSHLVADLLEQWASDHYADKNLVPDPASIETAPSSPYVIWPAAIREDVLSILRTMENDNLLVNVTQHAAGVTAAPTTIEGTTYVVVTVPFDVIPHLHSTVGEARQVG